MQDDFLTKEDTQMLKGIAVIMMIALHLWGFPERIAGPLRYSFDIFGQKSIMYFGGFGNICVDFFFFLSGYGLYKSNRGKNFDLIKRIKYIYISYWKVFLIFIPIAFLAFNNQIQYCSDPEISNRFSNFNWRMLISNFFAIEITYNREWWFIRSYLIAIITYPFVNKFLEKFNVSKKIMVVVVASIINNNVLQAIGNITWLGSLNSDWVYANVLKQVSPFISSFWSGIACSQGGILDKLAKEIENNKLKKLFFDFAMWMVLIYMRQIAIGPQLGYIYVPLLIVTAKDFTYKIPLIRKFMLQMGKHSTNMWLIHSFYCYYFYPVVKWVIYFKWALPSLVLLIMMSYLSSILVDVIWKGIGYGYNKIRVGIGRKFIGKC